MKLILSAGSLYTLPSTQVFEMARDAGFDGLEVIINHDFAGSQALAYLKDLYTQFGSWSLSLAAYNMGERGLQRAIEKKAN